MNKTESRKYVDRIIEAILVIIIIALFLHNCALNKKQDTKPINGGGTIDVFEIKCENKNSCKVEPSGDDNPSGDKKQNNGGNNNGSTTPDETVEGDAALVYDDEVVWQGTTEAKIFTNTMYDLDDVIAPESSNTYQFVVKNSTKYKLKYDVSFTEDNPYSVNMKYRLKRNGDYIIGDYVSANGLNITDLLLNSSSSDTFELEWKWFSSSNDTQIGTTLDASYSLKIEVKAESVNG